jgi:phosphoglycerol transferase
MNDCLTLSDPRQELSIATTSYESKPPAFGTYLRAITAYTASIVLPLAILALFLRPWSVSLRTPVAYDWGDGKLTLALIQGIVENGWYLHNDRLGAPFGLDMRSFPMADHLHFGIIRLLSLGFPDSGLLYNLYLIITFPLTTLCSLLVMRQFGVSYLPALIASLLYTFLPYHFLCGYCGHLFLASYYVVPLTLLVCMWLFLGRFPIVERNRQTGKIRIRGYGWRSLAVLLVCGLQASAGVYYAFFACFLMLAGGIAGCVRRRHPYPLIACVVLVATTTMAVVISVAPTIVHRLTAETPGEAVGRWPIHAEMGALKVTQLLLPVTNHRIAPLARLKGYYNSANAFLVNANDFTSLGLVGSIGFFVSLISLALRRDNTPSSRLLVCLGFLSVAAVLLATIGGLGSIFSTFLSPWIRSYYRISVFIAFLSLFAIAIVAERLRQRYVHSRRSALIYNAGLFLLACLGILDQTTPTFALPWVREAYADNQEYLRQIETALPEGSRVFQLPYLSFPESLGVHGVSDYEPIRGYLHSNKLRWSYGAMRGSEGDLWQARVAAMPPEKLAETLAFAGFAGIYLDRRGYTDGAAALEAKIRPLLGNEPLVSKDARFAFYDLRRFGSELRSRMKDSECMRRHEDSVQLVLFSWQNGFGGNLEGPANDNWRWCTTKGELFVLNNTPTTKRVEVTMCCKADNEVAARLQIDGELWKETLTIGASSQPFTRTLTVPPGKHKVTFDTDARVIPGIDPRMLVWRVTNFGAREIAE